MSLEVNDFKKKEYTLDGKKYYSRKPVIAIKREAMRKYNEQVKLNLEVQAIREMGAGLKPDEVAKGQQLVEELNTVSRKIEELKLDLVKYILIPENEGDLEYITDETVDEDWVDGVVRDFLSRSTEMTQPVKNSVSISNT